MISTAIVFKREASPALVAYHHHRWEEVLSQALSDHPGVRISRGMNAGP